MMKASELRTKSASELLAELNDLLRAQFSLRMQAASQQLGNKSQLSKIRKKIARTKTVMTELKRSA
jgi:large subunit ribosomal protein L29